MSRRRKKESSIGNNVLSFSNKKVSRNAIITMVIGTACLVGFALLILISILNHGRSNLLGGIAGCVFMILAFFGVFWGILSYDDAKTSQTLKIPGICINIVVIFLGITFIML